MQHSMQTVCRSRRTSDLSRRFGEILFIASILIVAIPAKPFGQELPSQFAGPRFAPPETMLVPMNSSAQSTSPSGWQLLYKNGLHGPEDPVLVTETRTVTLGVTNGRTTTGLISWQIFRTRNDTCAGATTRQCPDRFQVLSVPEGFIALPESAWVEEGEGLRVFIVPAGFG
jgi:hypothetical protein